MVFAAFYDIFCDSVTGKSRSIACPGLSVGSLSPTVLGCQLVCLGNGVYSIMMAKIPHKDESPPPGPTPDRLKITMNWEDAAEKVVKAKKPAKGWPGSRPAKKKARRKAKRNA